MNGPPVSLVLRGFQVSRVTIPTLRGESIGTKTTYGLRAQALWGYGGELGLIPHDQPGGPLVANLAAFWQQISPIVPVLPTVPAHKSCAVYNLAFEAFHGVEVVVGKIELQADRIPE